MKADDIFESKDPESSIEEFNLKTSGMIKNQHKINEKSKPGIETSDLSIKTAFSKILGSEAISENVTIYSKEQQSGKETIDQRLCRIKNEMEEIEAAIKLEQSAQNAEYNETLKPTIEEINRVKERITQISLARLKAMNPDTQNLLFLNHSEIQNLISQNINLYIENKKSEELKAKDESKENGSNSQLALEIFLNPNRLKLALNEKCVEIEKRVGELEEKIGEFNMDKSACTISQKLEILKEQIKFVSPKTSAECLEKINKILIDFESIPEKDYLLSIKEIDELYDYCKKSIEFSYLIPLIIERLENLKSIHEENASLSNRLNNLEKSQEYMQNLLKENIELRVNIKKSMEDSNKAMDSNLQSIESRIKRLQEVNKTN